MDPAEAAYLREALAGTGLPEHSDQLARAIRRSTRTPDGLLLTGPAEDEPWHLTAHLADEARYSGIRELAPTLLRWNVHPSDPGHLRHSVTRLAEARRGESVLVVSDEPDGDALAPLLERVADARRHGAAVFGLQAQPSELGSVVNDCVTVSEYPPGLVSFEGSQHLLSLAVGASGAQAARAGLRARLGLLLDRWAGLPS